MKASDVVATVGVAFVIMSVGFVAGGEAFFVTIIASAIYGIYRAVAAAARPPKFGRRE